ncbi:hypothetical protein [Cylindrospermopsis sp. CR12]|nr:hypothetical protein [Cylindrospermopsis sp. CR12]
MKMRLVYILAGIALFLKMLFLSDVASNLSGMSTIKDTMSNLTG